MGGRRWEDHYTAGETPWDTGQPSVELERRLTSYAVAPGVAIELGCGTGASAVWLAQRGFTVTACDISPTALTAARARAASASGVEGRLRFVEADLLADPPPALGPPADLVFDRGVYHVLRRDGGLERFLALLRGITRPGSLYVVLAGSCDDGAGPDVPGPPRIRAVDLCAELEPLFEVWSLDRFVWRPIHVGDVTRRPIGWSAVLSRR